MTDRAGRAGRSDEPAGRARRRRGAGPYLWLLGLAAAPLIGLAGVALFGARDAPPGPGFAPSFAQSDVAVALLLAMLAVMLVSVVLGATLIVLVRGRTRYGTWPVFVQGAIPVTLQFLAGMLLVVFAALD